MNSFRRPDTGERPAPRPVRLARVLFILGLLLVAAWLIVSAIRLVNAGRSLLEQPQRLEALVQAGILNAEAQEIEQITVTIRDDVAEIVQVAGPFAGVGHYLGWLPEIGPLLADSQELLEMADAGSEMAFYAVGGLKPLLAQNGQAGGLDASLPRVVSTLDAAGQQLENADLAAKRLFAARAALKHESEYPDRLLTLLSRLDENAGLIHDGLKLSLIAPSLLGVDQPRTYLILAQNEDELRPSGGFISGAGVLTIDHGQIVGLSFDNANGIDAWQRKPYGPPPVPFTEIMGMDIFLFRDANFWPDFAQSAAQAMALYSYGQDISLDGVIAIDQQFLRQLLAATGPLPVAELDRIVDANSVVNQLREEWGPGGDSENWITDRKAFMAPLADAFREQIESGLLSSHAFELATMLDSAARERHLQLYMADPGIASILDTTAWSGRMGIPGHSDFVNVTDTNMGFNKVNAVIERALTYRVQLDESGAHKAKLAVHYRNPATATGVECQHGTPYNPTTEYESITKDCYWNYLRAYAPKGSELLSASKHPVPVENLMSGVPWPGTSRTDNTESADFTVFDNFILLGTGQDETVSFDYALPETVVQSDGQRHDYRLYLRKQAGTTAESAVIVVTVPEGSTILETSPAAASVVDNVLTFEILLSTDMAVSVTYRE